MHGWKTCILTLDRAVNQRCTCVNKQKKKRKQVDIMKEYRQMPAAVESVGPRKARVRASLQRPPVEKFQPRCGRNAAMVKKRSWVNIAVCPYIHSSLTHHRNIENKVWEIHIFIKKSVRSSLSLIMFPLYICYVAIQQTSPFLVSKIWRKTIFTTTRNCALWCLWKDRGKIT